MRWCLPLWTPPQPRPSCLRLLCQSHAKEKRGKTIVHEWPYNTCRNEGVRPGQARVMHYGHFLSHSLLLADKKPKLRPKDSDRARIVNKNGTVLASKRKTCQIFHGECMSEYSMRLGVTKIEESVSSMKDRAASWEDILPFNNSGRFESKPQFQVFYSLSSLKYFSITICPQN